MSPQLLRHLKVLLDAYSLGCRSLVAIGGRTTSLPRATRHLIFIGIKPRTEVLVSGHSHWGIRLRLGVSLKAFPVQNYINRSSVISTDVSKFFFGKPYLSWPDFDEAEL